MVLHLYHHASGATAGLKTVVGSAFVAQAVSIAAEVATTGTDPSSWIQIGSNVSVVAILALVTKSFLSGSIVRVDVQREAAIQAAAHAEILEQLTVLRETLAQMRADHAVIQNAITRMERKRP